VALVSEADERLPAGPRGRQGERGERGMSPHLPGRSIVVLFLICVLGIFGNLYWTAREIGANDHKFCQVINSVVPVPRPADPAANPSRVIAYEQYERAASLGRSLGC
jgi:hypothetical protein